MIPSSSEYISALKEIVITDLQMEMLKIHYQAPAYTLTASEMANALGYTHYSVSNGNYGRLGSRLGDQLKWNPKEYDLGVAVLATFAKPDNNWRWIMRPELISALEKLGWVDPSTTAFPNEIDDSEIFIEGATKKITVNAYERNPKARSKCISHHGYKCFACNTLLSDIYGEIAERYIHIHHRKQLSEVGEAYDVDPVVDLVPVCPNCHAMIHRKNPPYTVEQIREIYKKNNANK